MLIPNGIPKNINDIEHQSKLENPEKHNELATKGLFTIDQLQLIDQLIAQNQWIIEESNDLLAMLNLQTLSS